MKTLNAIRRSTTNRAGRSEHGNHRATAGSEGSGKRAVRRIVVVAALLATLTVSAQPASAGSNSQTATPSVDTNLRAGPGVSYDKVGVLTAGSAATVDCKTMNGSRAWYKLGEGRWMSSKHVSAKPSVSTCPTATSSNGTATLTMDTTRKGHGTITINNNTYKFNSGTSSLWSTPAGTYDVTADNYFRDDKIRCYTKAKYAAGDCFSQAYKTRKSFSIDDAGDGDYKRFGYSFWLTGTTSTRGQGTVLDTRQSAANCSGKVYSGKCYRTLIKIHPDGGNAGTAGCLGIVGNEATQRQFRDDMMAEIDRNGGSFRLTVEIVS